MIETHMSAAEICGEVWKVMRNAPTTSDVRSHLDVGVCSFV